MSDIAIQVENLGKLYRLGEIGTGTLSQDLSRWWARVRGKEDPFALVGETNDRTVRGQSDFVWSLKDVSFEVKQGEVLGIIGRNGAGKSTLLKILSKVTAPTTGRVKIQGRIASLLEVGTGFHPELTGRENIFLNGAILGMNKSEIRKKFDEIVDFSGVERYIDTPVKRYSSGMYVRLAFAVAAFLEPEILIVDEVLAVGDAEFQKKCLGRMKDVSVNGGRTVLFVSHNMDAVRSLCTRGVYMQNGGLHSSGEISEVVANYYQNVSINLKSQFKISADAPSIKAISLNAEALNHATIDLTVEFESPFDLQPPIAGFVLYNALDTPILGSNARYHHFEGQNISSKSGVLRAVVNNIELHSGTYKISVWLGDASRDYDVKTEIIVFEYLSNVIYASKPDALLIGPVDKIAHWSYHE
ncbi:ABC transporter ATP-binding protein [Hymenobacter latericus]|uniref:ABC transporter ATP-binding protein n=1 Tax=Hymenobacter sp. YIM 151858-1 TaxID=2987688 RepID=UPI002227BF22|nr:polysaccharide ABC transporter ATP-binding protein [Hymenobacter sp. YIM 151858-1]UYZ57458.1 polysaccharide ABC transporter ATP-binding protein [Hymenobacter sp. YIM 151858-1]